VIGRKRCGELAGMRREVVMHLDRAIEDLVNAIYLEIGTCAPRLGQLSDEIRAGTAPKL
jgi:hypothetical protein